MTSQSSRAPATVKTIKLQSQSTGGEWTNSTRHPWPCLIIIRATRSTTLTHSTKTSYRTKRTVRWWRASTKTSSINNVEVKTAYYTAGMMATWWTHPKETIACWHSAHRIWAVSRDCILKVVKWTKMGTAVAPPKKGKAVTRKRVKAKIQRGNRRQIFVQSNDKSKYYLIQNIFFPKC